MSKSLTRRSEEHFRLFEELQRYRINLVANALKVGQILWKLRERNGYKDILGDPKGTWNKFLAMPEVSLPYSTAHKMMRLYEVFKVKFPTADSLLFQAKEYKLKMILPHVTEENKDALMQAAVAQSEADLEITIAEVVKGVDAYSCRHKDLEKRESWLCKNCRERFAYNPHETKALPSPKKKSKKN